MLVGPGQVLFQDGCVWPAMLYSFRVEEALDWLIDHQEEDGLWKATYVSGKEVDNARARETRLWVSLAICRVLRRVS
jgi:hypothetical protein